MFGLEDTTLYYLYSTTAQTLGALFGIVAAFTLFKIQSLKDKLDSGLDDCCKNLLDSTKYEDVIYASNMNVILANNRYKEAFAMLEDCKIDTSSTQEEHYKKLLTILQKSGEEAYTGDFTYVKEMSYKLAFYILKSEYKKYEKIKKDIVILAFIVSITIVSCLTALYFIPYIKDNNIFMHISSIGTLVTSAICLGLMVRLIKDMIE